MRDRSWQIGVCGTFDLENYGDLLFPLIAEAELIERLGAVKLQRFSYHARRPPGWPYAVTSLTDLPQLIGNLDGILIGGGFIIRFDKEVAPAYGPPTGGIHHPTGYWLTPALLALQHGVPLIWNAPGMHCNDIPAWAGPLMNLAFSLSRYIAVRDEPSQTALARFAGAAQINLVPDTAFGITRLLSAEPSAEFERLRVTSGLTGPYIIIQAALGLESFQHFVKRHAQRLREYRILALPIGPVLGDDAAILEASELAGLVRLPFWPQPLLLAELISHAAGVVGHSYHLAITALANGVPVFTPTDISVGKYSALQGFKTLYHLAKDEETDPDWFLQRLGKTKPSTAAQTALKQLERHWDCVAVALETSATATQPAVNQFWQSLPMLLEGEAFRYQSMVMVSAARSTEQQNRLDESNLRLEQAHAEIAAQDDRLNLASAEMVTHGERTAALYNSTTWKITAPLRFILHNLKRLTGNGNGR